MYGVSHYIVPVCPQNLDVTVTLYNKVHEIILDVEQPLIAGQLAAIDGQLERAISELNWTSEGGALGGQQPLPTNTEICHTHTSGVGRCFDTGGLH